MEEFSSLGRNNRKDDTCQSEPSLNYASSSSEFSAREELQFPMSRSLSLK